MMDMSETIGALAGALALAQATISGAAKDRKNDHFKASYATLSSVWDAWQDAGPAQGLSITQLPGAFADGKVTLTTILAHKSGEWMRETLAIPVTKSDAQGYGSALTYARRYALSAFVGIAPEDDDGNAAVGHQRGRAANEPQAAPSGPVNADQLATLLALADEVGADMPRFCKYFQVGSLAEIPASRFGDASAALNAKRKVRA